LANARTVRTRNVVVSAGVMGTLRLLFRCRDVTRSLPKLSPQLGKRVRTNSESLTGVLDRRDDIDYSKGIAITSIFRADDITYVEPVRYPNGSSLMRFLAGPMIEAGDRVGERLGKVFRKTVSRPDETWRMMARPGWARNTTILLAMQTEDTFMHVRPGRHPLTLFRNGLVSELEPGQVMGQVEQAHSLTYAFAEKVTGIPAASVSESLFNVPMTAHILGGCNISLSPDEGVVGLDCQVHNYPGLYVIDNSIMPGNPGVNPSLTTTALAEYAMSQAPVLREYERLPK
jgi:cholesterol oxidase